MTCGGTGVSSFFAFAGKSDVGRKRGNNEDSFGIFADAGMFFVADGMGGGDDGEIASAAVIQAVEKCARALSPTSEGGYAAEDMADAIDHAVNEASDWIFRRADEKRLNGCGSTVVGFCLDRTDPGRALALHAGDSRLYRIRGGSIRQVTKDHSAAEMIGVKDERRVNPIFRGMVLRAVGVAPFVTLEHTPFDVKPGDCLLVCSDGLSRMVSDREIKSIVERNANAEKAVSALVDAANAAGGIDNVTAVLVLVGDLPRPVERLPIPAALVSQDDAETSDANAERSATTDSLTPSSSGAFLPTDDEPTADSGTDGAERDTAVTPESPDMDAKASRVFERRAKRLRLKRKTLRMLAVSGMAAVFAAIALFCFAAVRSHVRKRERVAEEIRGEVERRQEQMRRQERERAEEVRRVAEAERANAERKRKADDDESRRVLERERAHMQAIRDEAEKRSEEEARMRTERRRLEEENRKHRRPLRNE